ncbi:hypothetical protein PHLCEN_2v13054 [Hermanssonia centrifuga]|uniref:Thioredoxin domain-containing protein n=1 Tax=Hermanssonia centrifuga TaxID=98765 RepID=A0A2R6NFC4_9APHY|nr:hypothetical protein PHLCEN_2v13054 [Hermanssonia centrifuga]
MPLRYTEDPASLESVKDISEKYIVFYSSRGEDGKLWCPDCRDVERLVEQTFTPTDGLSGLIVYVGQKQEYLCGNLPCCTPPALT